MGAGNELDLKAVDLAIDECHRSYVMAMKAGDPIALACHFTEDAVLLPQGAKMQKGRSTIQQWFGSWLPAMIIDDFEITTSDVVLVNDTVYEVGTFRMTARAKGANEASSDVGKYLMVWKRQTDGKWRIVRDMFNTDTRPTAAK